MAKITSPVEGYTGVVAGVKFEDGQGETDNEGALAYFHAAGYTVDGGDDDFQLEGEATPYLENPAGALGTPVDNPKGPIDAADPDNDLVPVGGVKSAAAPGAPEPRTSRGKRKANTSDQPADTTPQVPTPAGGTPADPDGSVQSAPSATTATTPGAAPVGDDSAADYSSATPAPDPLKAPVSQNTAKDAAVQEQTDTSSDASAPEDQKGADQSPTGATAAADNQQKAKG